MALEAGLVDGLGRNAVLEDAADGVEDFVAAAVVEGNVEGEAGVLPCQVEAWAMPSWRSCGRRSMRPR